MTEMLYRYHNYRVSSGINEWGESVGSYCKVGLSEYPIIKRTKYGAWIGANLEKRFVRLNAHKKFACIGKIEALQSFIARKKRQTRILKAQLKDAEEALNIGLELLKREERGA